MPIVLNIFKDLIRFVKYFSKIFTEIRYFPKFLFKMKMLLLYNVREPNIYRRKHHLFLITLVQGGLLDFKIDFSPFSNC